MHLSEKYYAGDNLFYLRYCALNDDFSPRYSSTYVDEAVGIMVTYIASLTINSSGEARPHQLGLNLDGTMVYYLNIHHVEADRVAPHLLQKRPDDKSRLH